MKGNKSVSEQPYVHEEKRIIRRLTFKNVLEDLLDAWNVQRGLLFTLKLLFTKPGELIRRYLGADRYRITSPFKLLFITTGLALLLTLQFDINHQYLHGFTEGFNEANSGENRLALERLEIIINDYFNLILWSSTPIYAFAFYLFIRRGFNFLEHLVINVFYLGAGNILFVLIMPSFNFGSIGLYFYAIISIFYLYFMYAKGLNFNKWHHYARLLLAYIFGTTVYLLTLTVAITALFILN